MQNGSKRKGEALDMDSKECGEKEKWLTRELVVFDTSFFMRLAKVAEQPHRVQ